MSTLADWLNTNVGLVSAFAVGAGIIGALAVWIVYRLGVREQRSGLLDALRKELDLHRSWIEGPYIRGITPTQPQWFDTDYTGTVYKLSIIAVDAAITTGPSLFLNRNLLPALVGYRQRVLGFNQQIDRAEALQANPELYRRFPNRRLVARVRRLLADIHYMGVGHPYDNLPNEGYGKASYLFRYTA